METVGALTAAAHAEKKNPTQTFCCDLLSSPPFKGNTGSLRRVSVTIMVVVVEPHVLKLMISHYSPVSIMST
jgi:hypothetical protein